MPLIVRAPSFVICFRPKSSRCMVAAEPWPVGYVWPMNSRFDPYGCAYRLRPGRESNQIVRKSRGFTLIELMTTIAIAAILVIIAIPNFNSFVKNNTLTTSANNLVFALNYARNEAVKRDAVVTLCPTSDGQTCIASSTSWSTGWLVVTGTAATPLQAWPALPSNFTLVTKVSGATTNVAPIQYQPSGLTGSSATVQFILCDSRGPSKAVELELTPTGRIEAALTAGYSVGGPPPSGTGTALTTCS